MRARSSVGVGVIGVLLIGACSAAPTGEVARPKPEITPIPTAKAKAKAPRPSGCEVAALLVTKAEALRADGFLARAGRALDDAEARCPAKAKDVAEARAKVESARAVGAGESAQGIAEAMGKIGSGDAAARRREKERWLTALEREAGQKTRISAPDPGMPVAFEWAPDGSRGASLHGGELSIWDADLRTETARYDVGREMLDLRWLPSGHAVIVADLEKGSFRVVDLEKKKAETVFKVPGFGADSFFFSADGKTMVVRSDTLVTLVDFGQKKVISALPYSNAAVALSPAGDRVAVGFQDGSARVHSLTGIAPLYQIQLPSSGSAAWPVFQSDKRLLVLSDSQVATFDAANGSPVGKPLVNDNCSPSVIGPARDRILWACYAYLEVESAKGSARKRLYTPGTMAHLYTSFDTMTIAPDGSSLWYSLWGQRYLVDTRTGKLLADGAAPTYFGMRIQPGSKRLAAVTLVGTGLWTSDLKKEQRYVIGDGDPGNMCSWMGVSAAGGPVFGDVAAVDEGQPSTTVALRGPGEIGKQMGGVRVEACPEAISADASRFGAEAGDTISLIDLQQGEAVGSFPAAPEDLAASVSLSADGKVVVLGSASGVQLRDVATKAVTSEWKVPVPAREKLVVSRSGRRVFVRGDGGGKLYTAGQEAPVELSVGPGPLAFAGEDALVEARDLSVVVHDLAAREERSIPGVAAPKRLLVSPDGAVAIVVVKDGSHVIDLAYGAGVLGKFPALREEEQVVFFGGGRAIGVYSPQGERAQFYGLPSAAPLGELLRRGPKSAVYTSETGNLEVFGDGASSLACARDPQVLPFADCADRLLEPGLLARTVAGRGCTSEDVGDVCE